MIRSMTGFGRAEATGGAFAVGVEIRSVNHRHLDVALKLPRVLSNLESEARRLVQSRVERGRIEITAQLAPGLSAAPPRLEIDEALAREYLERARALARVLGVEGEVTLDWLLDRPGVIHAGEAEPIDAEAVWPTLAEALGRALDELIARRSTEGQILAVDLRLLHEQLAAQVEVMTARAPLASARRADRLRERLTALLSGVGIDESRIVTEMAVWAEKTDISEELTRLGAHLTEFRLMLDKGGAVGRPFDFLIQEINREVNTVASKADDLELTQATIAAKGILEKIREQVQNLE